MKKQNTYPTKLEFEGTLYDGETIIENWIINTERVVRLTIQVKRNDYPIEKVKRLIEKICKNAVESYCLWNTQVYPRKLELDGTLYDGPIEEGGYERVEYGAIEFVLMIDRSDYPIEEVKRVVTIICEKAVEYYC